MCVYPEYLGQHHLLGLVSVAHVLTSRYLYTEWEDPVFGPRAAYVHTKFQNAKASSEILTSISKQMGLMAQLRHIVADLKVCPGSLSCTASSHELLPSPCLGPVHHHELNARFYT